MPACLPVVVPTVPPPGLREPGRSETDRIFSESQVAEKKERTRGAPCAECAAQRKTKWKKIRKKVVVCVCVCVWVEKGEV